MKTFMNRMIEAHNTDQIIAGRKEGAPFSTLFNDHDMMLFVSECMIHDPEFYDVYGAIDAVAETPVFTRLCQDMQMNSPKFVGRTFFLASAQWMVDALDDVWCEVLHIKHPPKLKIENDPSLMPVEPVKKETLDRVIHDIVDILREDRTYGEPITVDCRHHEAREFTGRILATNPDEWLRGGVLDAIAEVEFWEKQAHAYREFRDLQAIGNDVCDAFSKEVLSCLSVIESIDERSWEQYRPHPLP